MEETEQTSLSTRDIIIRYGLICGAVSILFTAILYAIDAKLLFGYYINIALVASFIVAVLAAAARKKNNNGYISYGDSVVTSLAAFSVGEVVYTLFMLLMYFVIDKRLIDVMKSVKMEQVDQFMAKGYLNKVQYTASQASIDNINNNTILFYSLMGPIVIIIIGLLIFLLTSIFIKNEKSPV